MLSKMNSAQKKMVINEMSMENLTTGRGGNTPSQQMYEQVQSGSTLKFQFPQNISIEDEPNVENIRQPNPYKRSQSKSPLSINSKQ